MRGEALRLQTAVSWLLVLRGFDGQELGGSTSLTVNPRARCPRGKGNCSLKMWVPLALGSMVEQKQKKTKDSTPGPPPGEGAEGIPNAVIDI